MAAPSAECGTPRRSRPATTRCAYTPPTSKATRPLTTAMFRLRWSVEGRVCSLLLLAGAAEAARAAHGLFEVFGPSGLWGSDGFDDELRDARARLYPGRLVAVVAELAQNLAAIVRINPPSQYVYPLGDSEPRARRDAAVEALGD